MTGLASAARVLPLAGSFYPVTSSSLSFRHFASVLDEELRHRNGLIAPAKTPAPVIAAIAREVNEALRDGGIREKLHAQYMEPLGTSPAEFKTFVDAEMRRWTPVVQAAKIKMN
jgi:hypothetical protein